MSKFSLIVRFAALLLPITAFATGGVVVSEHRLATQAGIEMLQQGGNAIDAAVAVGYALAVVNPCCGNIGGGGFMTIHLANGKNVFINFREKAPLQATANMFQNQIEASTKGWRAVAVPGTVMGLNKTLEKYGTLPLKKVITPAIKLANEGYIVTPYQAKQFQQFAKEFREQPNVAAIFLHNNHPYAAGERFQQKELAKTLELIATHGTQAFYQGSIAKSIVAASQTHHGLLTQKDFDQYHLQELSPVMCGYRGYEIISAPLPSSGGITLCEMLAILENFPLSKLGHDNPKNIYYILEAMRYAFIDRNTKLGDTTFVETPIKELLSPHYTHQISQQIKNAQRLPHKVIEKPMHELTDTTHYSIIDNKGNAVAVTYTLNGFFGARVMAGNTGFFLNNEMDDFTTQLNTPNKFNLIQGSANSIQPGKRPLSSMTPTVVMKDNRVFMVLGSPGGPRIITSVLLTLLNVIDFHMTLQKAVDTPRFHFQASPDNVFLETNAFNQSLLQQINKLGYKTLSQAKWGAVEAIMIPAGQKPIAVNDVRRPDGAGLMTN